MVIKTLRNLIKLGGNSAKSQWQDEHQKFELNFHRHNNYRWDDEAFIRQWTNIFHGFMGFNIDSFKAGQSILDIGCGSRPALDWFTGSPCHKYYLDPLLKQYMTIPEVTQYWVGKELHYLLACPAEKHIKALDHKCDFIVCWNVLDHTYDWRRILHNITSYCKLDGMVCIGTDFDSHGVGHPGIDDKEYFMSFINRHFRTVHTVSHLHDRELALSLAKQENR